MRKVHSPSQAKPLEIGSKENYMWQLRATFSSTRFRVFFFSCVLFVFWGGTFGRSESFVRIWNYIKLWLKIRNCIFDSFWLKYRRCWMIQPSFMTRLYIRCAYIKPWATEMIIQFVKRNDDSMDFRSFKHKTILFNLQASESNFNFGLKNFMKNSQKESSIEVNANSNSNSNHTWVIK